MRKGGCGRKKINPQGVIRLEEWILEQTRVMGKKISRNQIKEEAIRIFNIESFRASKAWMDKFIKEQNLKFKIQKILLEKGLLSKCQEMKHKQQKNNLKEKDRDRLSSKKQLKNTKLEQIKLKEQNWKQDYLDIEINLKIETKKNGSYNKEDELQFTISFDQEAELFAEIYDEELYLGFD